MDAQAGGDRVGGHVVVLLRMAEAIGVDVGLARHGDAEPQAGALTSDVEDAAELGDAARGGADGVGGWVAIGDGVDCGWRGADGRGGGRCDGDAAEKLGGLLGGWHGACRCCVVLPGGRGAESGEDIGRPELGDDPYIEGM